MGKERFMGTILDKCFNIEIGVAQSILKILPRYIKHFDKDGKLIAEVLPKMSEARTEISKHPASEFLTEEMKEEIDLVFQERRDGSTEHIQFRLVHAINYTAFIAGTNQGHSVLESKSTCLPSKDMHSLTLKTTELINQVQILLIDFVSPLHQCCKAVETKWKGFFWAWMKPT